MNNKGFSLIELMITVAIIGIIAAVAYPSYLSYIQQSWRESARLCLLDMTQQMERRYAADLAYTLIDADGDGEDDQLYSTGCAVDGDMPSRYTFVGAINTGYAIYAMPKGGQASDKCGAIGIDQDGKKDVRGSASVAECWN